MEACGDEVMSMVDAVCLQVQAGTLYDGGCCLLTSAGWHSV